MRLKYVIFRHKAGMFMPVIFPEHVTHSQVKLEGSESGEIKVFSAGFCGLDAAGVWVGKEKSESLNLGPNEVDAFIIENVFKGMPMWSYIDY